MAGTKTAKKKPSVVAKASKGKGFSDFEKSAMRQRVKELQSGKADGEADVLGKIAEMTPSDRAIAKRIHQIVKASAPVLSPKTWYGMPAYARDGKIVCFFQPAQKFKTRYATFGFNDIAKLDEGTMWPIGWAITELTAAVEERIAALVKKAAS
jgi:uncharacterized protein YdhG (YjbR/CyaY superfamily)